ncbi:hypothetical protein ACM46_11340 [Chryseobacterium angstadtii]|uniref:Uncharacterized protein n=1 Tax=Chryseobacterium angstadtii TaxID=558151 RepID=A0A0J7IED8_9FLAO|nr:hypothetical protein [Chryseobacterium angstadtii]KMQ64813.1 hypothetical protein ACM46_11340 [Chryseobacterium angstadtii]
MKKTILTLTLLGGFAICFGQSIIGKYAESAIIAPDKVRNMMQNDVVITQDKSSSKKIWISNLIGKTTFYAVRNAANEDKEVYNIPPQNMAGYAVNIGCIVFDKEEQQISIALNNKSNCLGMSPLDYGNVSVGKGGIKAGGVKVGANGEISAGGTKTGKKGVSVNAKQALSGVQYVGSKK